MKIKPNLKAGRKLRRGGLVVAAMAISTALVFAATIGPDSYGFRASSNGVFSFVDISTTGTRILAGSDDDAAELSLPFTFSFYGSNYTSLCVSSNGLITFGGCNPDFANSDLSALNPGGNLPSIAVLWDDLTFAQPGSDGLYYETLGAPGSRQFVLQWNNVFGLNSPSAMKFEAILKENSGQIILQYDDVDSGTPNSSKGAGATVGIRDKSGNQNGKVLQWSYDVPVINDHIAIEFTSAIIVAIDVRPGNSQNPINLKANGVLPVAILSTDTFDATTVNPETARLSGSLVNVKPRGKPQFHKADVNGDKVEDIVLQFEIDKLELSVSDEQVTLTAQTSSGQHIRGVDAVRIVP